MLIVFIRVFIIFTLIVISLRLMGKHQLGQLQPSELVVTILVSNIATMAIEDTSMSLVQGIVPILSLVAFDVIMSYLSLKFKIVRRLVSGSPRVIIRDGKVDQQELFELRFTIDDLMEQLRDKDIFDLRDVSFAIVETTGKVSVLPKFEAQSVTPKMLKLEDDPAASAPPAVLISDGTVINSALKYCNLSYEWLIKVVSDNGYKIDDVFIMICTREANYKIIPKEKIKKNGSKQS